MFRIYIVGYNHLRRVDTIRINKPTAKDGCGRLRKVKRRIGESGRIIRLFGDDFVR